MSLETCFHRVNSQKRKRHLPLNKVSPDQLNEPLKTTTGEFYSIFFKTLSVLFLPQVKKNKKNTHDDM